MANLLLELFSEEIPARMQRKAAGDLKKILTDALVDNGLTYEAAREFWTPRRLVIDLRGLTSASRTREEVRKGPSVKAPQQAIAGFLRNAGLSDISQAEIVQDAKKGDYYVATIAHPGRKAQEIIAEILPQILRAFPWPKSMRWGLTNQSPAARWVRPLHTIICLFGLDNGESEIIDFEFAGVRSGRITYGHRFLSDNSPLSVRDVQDYQDKLLAAKVVLDGERRKDMILTDARNLCFASGVELVEDEALLEEVSGLVEWPQILMGRFDENFLSMPPEIIRLTIRANQKCFVTRPQAFSEKGAQSHALSNHFILVSNLQAPDDGEQIIKGNERVVRARLSDALYFWQTDQADLPDLSGLEEAARFFDLDLAKPLDQRMARLAKLNVTFHAKLGTQGARVQRIGALTEMIAPRIGANPSLAKRAALLAKADLQTDAVNEFPELQGLMGYHYALLQGEEQEVARAIEEHYKPQGPSDKVPTTPICVALALADKIDMLAGFWIIDEKPTGSKDPYALRRAALGVIRLCLARDWHIALLPLFEAALQNYVAQGIENSSNTKNIALSLLQFLHERLRVYLKEEGARHDAIEAILDHSQDDLLQVARRVEALIAFIQTPEGGHLLATTRRAVNILAAEELNGHKIEETHLPDPTLFVTAQEHTLFAALLPMKTQIQAHLEAGDFSGALRSLSSLHGDIDAFFEHVLVNDADVKIRINRLALLAQIRAITTRLADFAKLSL